MEFTSLSLSTAFEAAADRHADATAVIDDGRLISFRQLNRQANRLARELLAHGIGCGDAVGLLLPRDHRWIVATLGVLKCGGICVPLEPSFPEQRTKWILEDAGCRLLIVDQGQEETARAHALQRIIVADAGIEISGSGALPGRRPPVAPDTLAFIIYTSGSTGQPKGVELEHRGMLLTARATADVLQHYGARRLYHFFSHAFDVSVLEMFTALLGSIELFIEPQGPQRSAPDSLLAMLKENGVDTLFTTPSYMAELQAENVALPKIVMVCGEACPPVLARRLIGRTTLLNGYGPTETSMLATLGPIERAEERITIGLSLPHVDIVILDDTGRPVEDGGIGSIWIGGKGVARGYRGKPELTAQRFRLIADATGAPTRAYDTGDLGARRPDGGYDFFGRDDDQFKIRGYRVEANEIEACIVEMATVRAAAVVACDDLADRRIVAFVDGTNISQKHVIDHLTALLPTYMIPDHVEIVSTLPKLASGKIDRVALVAKAADLVVQGRKVPESEDPLAAIWQAALKIASIGEDDDYFELDGHSRAAAEIIAATAALHGIEISLRTLFDHPSLRSYRIAVQNLIAAS